MVLSVTENWPGLTQCSMGSAIPFLPEPWLESPTTLAS